MVKFRVQNIIDHMETCLGIENLKLLRSTDFEFALRLEPENKELLKQYLEAKQIHEVVCI